MCHTICGMSDPKNIVSFRIRPETMNRVKVLAEKQGVTASTFVSDLLDAYTDRRVMVLAEPLGHNINDGMDKTQPVLIEGA